MSPLNIELVINSRSVALGIFMRDFMRDRKIPVTLRVFVSEKGRAIRALFAEKDDDKVYPILVVMKGDVVVWKLGRPGVSKLYSLYYWYNDNKESG